MFVSKGTEESLNTIGDNSLPAIQHNKLNEEVSGWAKTDFIKQK